MAKKLLNDISRNAHLLLAKGKKYSPEIALVGGLVGSTVGTVWACVSSTKLEERIEPVFKDLEDEKNDIEAGIVEAPKTWKFKHYKKLFKECIKLYGIPVAIKILSDGAVVYAFKTEKGRYTVAVSAYDSLATAFAAYRTAVAEEIGEEAEHNLYNGGKTTKVTYTDPDTGESFDEFEKTWGPGYGPFAVEFARGKTRYFEDEFDLNVIFVRGREAFLNTELDLKGVVTVNDVLDCLGLLETRTPEQIKQGLNYGWVKNKTYPDTYIDLGIKEFYAIDHPKPDSILNHAIPLNLNVQGNINSLL